MTQARSPTDPAPIYIDSFDLAAWLLRHFDQDVGALGQRLCATALELLEDVTLALKDHDRAMRLRAADGALIRLRLLLRLTEPTGLLDEAQRLFALEGADRIGRQLGGWQRALTRLS